MQLDGGVPNSGAIACMTEEGFLAVQLPLTSQRLKIRRECVRSSQMRCR